MIGAAAAAIAPRSGASASQPIADLLDRAAALPALRTVIVSRDGTVLAERGYGRHSPDRPANVKSASKAIIAGLVGAAIDRGLIAGTDQPIAGLLRRDVPPNPDPRLATVTVGHLLSMRAGLRRTSGANYGRWVARDNWVRSALAQPFVAEPGGPMLYSTGSSHLLSAILTRVCGRSTKSIGEDWFGAIPGFRIASWDRDPQGIYLGGNQMSLTPRALWAFGDTLRAGGVTSGGTRVLSQSWVDRSWQIRTRSRYTGHGYGYGWFLTAMAGEDASYAWGYGGQMLYVVPRLGLTAAMTSDPSPRSRSETISQRDHLHALMAAIIAQSRDTAG